MIMVQSTFFLVDETKDEALELMKVMVGDSRRESGCVSYEYFAGITEANQVVLLQEWTDAESLQGHYQSAHMEEFLGKLGLYLESEVITRTYASPDEPIARRADARDEADRKQRSDKAAKAPQTIH